MGFAEPDRPRISPQGRAPPCASVGGYMKRPCGGVVRFTLGASTRQPSQVVQSHFIRRRSCVVPYGLPGYRRLRRAPPLHPPPQRRRASVKNPVGAREYPVCAAGWALWVTGGSPHLLYSHRGYRRVGEAFRAAASPSGPPLGAPRRCLREAKAARPRLRTALWGIQKGKADAPSGEPGDTLAGASRRGARGRLTASRLPVTRELYRPETSGGRPFHPKAHDSYLVDSASSHMLVSKIKPCMSKYKQLYSETANGSLNQLSFI
jgi:hypothetical protein